MVRGAGLTDGEGWFYFSWQLLIVCSSSSTCGALWGFSHLPLQVVLLYGPCSGDHSWDVAWVQAPVIHRRHCLPGDDVLSILLLSSPHPLFLMFLSLKCSGCIVRVSIWMGTPWSVFPVFSSYGFLQWSPCPIKRHSFDEEWEVHLL